MNFLPNTCPASGMNAWQSIVFSAKINMDREHTRSKEKERKRSRHSRSRSGHRCSRYLIPFIWFHRFLFKCNSLSRIVLFSTFFSRPVKHHAPHCRKSSLSSSSVIANSDNSEVTHNQSSSSTNQVGIKNLEYFVTISGEINVLLVIKSDKIS